MLLKFTSSDIRDTSLVDCGSGAVAYRTVTPCQPRARSGSSSTLKNMSSLSSFGRSMADLRAPTDEHEKTTFIQNAEGNVLAEISWVDSHASLIQIGDEVIRGPAELFDAPFVKIYPDETLLPTRIDYTWRTTPDELTLLDDDNEVIGKLHPRCIMTQDHRLTPARHPEDGDDYFQLDAIPADEVLEIIVCCLLVKQLRERMYHVRNFIPQRRDPFARLRRHATRSVAILRDTFRRIPETDSQSPSPIDP